VVFFTVRSTSIEFARSMPLQILGIAVAEAHQIVVRAGDVVAVEHLGLVAHRLLEGLQQLVAHRRQVDDREAGAVLAQRLGVEQRHVLGDDAVVLEPLDAAQAGRRRKVNALGELDVRQPAVGLQRVQDLPVDRIELRPLAVVSHEPRQIRTFFAFYCASRPSGPRTCTHIASPGD